MNHFTEVLCRRNLRAYISAFITYLMLAGQAAPLALAASPRAAAPPRPDARAHTAPAPSARPAPAPVFAAPNITATKVDSWDDSATPDGKAEPGQTITYTVTITNTGDADATGVTFSDSVDPNTTLVPGSITTQPIAVADSYNVIGNVRIQIPDGANDLLANDCDPDPNGGACTNAGLTASGPTTTTQNGNITINSDGSFSYNPAPGFAGTDTVTYTVTDPGGKTDTAVATFKVGNGTATPGTNVVWFINNDPSAPAGNDGRITSPFNSIASYNASAATKDPGDIIFIYTGTSNYVGTLTLAANQRVVGQGASDTLSNIGGLTVPTGSDALPATGGTRPTLTTTVAATNALVVSAGGITVRGVTVGNTTGAKIFGSNFGTLTVGNATTPDVLLNGSGQALNLTNGTLAANFVSITSTSSGTQGITLDQIAGLLSSPSGTTISGNASQCILITASSAAMSFGNTSCTGGTDGISLQNNTNTNTRTFNTLNVSGGSGIAFLHSNGGGPVLVAGAATLASTGNPVDIQNSAGVSINFSGGATVTKTSAGGAGVNLVASSVTFESLGITTSNGPGLSAVTSGTVTVTNGSKAISATGSAGQAAPAIIANAVTLNANFSSVTSTNSGNTTNGKGISLTTVAGTSNFGTGSITGASDVSFFATGGNGSVTYNGTITQTTAARVIDVQNKTGGTFAFGGAITSNNGTGRGVFLNSNTGGSVFSFTAGLALSTATNDAFTATSSGTVTATQNNTSIVNTLATTTGQALKVTSTTIGASGLTFRSISSNGGTTTNGVTLDTTGSGAFTITGNGTVASGGTIQNKGGTDGNTTQGIGIYLNSVGGAVSLTRIDIEGCQNYGIRGVSVTGGLTIDNSTVGTTTKNGTTFTTDAEAVTGTQGEASLRFTNLTGTVAFSNDSFDRGLGRTVHIHNSTAGSTLTLNITNSTLRQTLNSVNGGDPAGGTTDALLIQAISSATINLNVSGSHFTSYRQFGIIADARDTATMNIDIGSCDFSNDNTATLGAAGSLNFGGSGAPGNDVLVKYNVHNNTFRHGSGATTPTTGGAHIVSGGVSGGVKFEGKILNNTFGVSGVPNTGAGGGADALRLFATGNDASTTRVTGSTHTRYLVQGNTIQRYGETGIQFNARQGNSTIDATVIGNIIREPGTAAQGAFAGIWVNSGALASDTNTVNIGIGSATVAADKNTLTDTDPNNFSDVFLDNKSCAGCASQLRLYQNGSDAAGATTEDKARDVLVDDNVGPLSLSTGFTQGGTGFSTITFVAGLPPQPTAPSLDTITPVSRNREVLSTPPSTTGTSTQGSSVTSTAFVSPSRTSPVLVAAPPRTTTATATAAPAPASSTTTTASGGRTTELTPVIDGAGGTVSVQIGTLAPGDSVTITFQVTVDNPFLGALPQVSNQGTVSGGNFSNVLTDDPDVAGSNNPTVTPVNAAKIKINDAKQAEPASGTRDMVFTVALTTPAGGNVTVDFTTMDEPAGPGKAVGGTCGSGGDYTPTSGQVSFTAGQQVKTINVPICSDATPEPDETFLVKLSNPVGAPLQNTQATGTITAADTPGTLLISELRTRGTAGANDDFVELYNNTASPINVNGYGVFKMGAGCAGTPVLVGTLPNVSIPARGHYLLVGSAYSLANYGGTGAAAGDLLLTADIEDDANVAVFSTTALDSIASTNKVDGVGFGTNVGGVCDLMREGATLAPVGALNIDYSYFRKECDYVQNVGCSASGNPKDTNENANDFLFADTAMTSIAGITRRLGAPGPENASSPKRRDDQGVLVLSLDGTKSQAAIPNRDRDFINAGANAPNGTLYVRRRIQNTTASTVTRLRFRIIEMTTGPTPPVGTADFRALTSTPVVLSGIQDPATCSSTGTPTTVPCQVTAQATTLETPPAQPNGGGYNSTLSVNIPGGLAPNASIDVNFALGVVQGGTFRFYIIVEALP